MIMPTIDQLDKLYSDYGYELSNDGNESIRVYKMRYGMYHAAEIVCISPDAEFKKLKAEFSEQGYATEVRNFNSIEEAEKALFEGFFIKTPISKSLSKRYERFIERQIEHLPEGSQYKYINSPYEYFLFNEKGTLLNFENIYDAENNSIIDKINDIVSSTYGPLLIIIEAAAGFGKTCSAYEILNTFSVEDHNKLPFFTELSRNREARVFKHILHNEIFQQFPTGINADVVLYEIKKGRIPLIIDGFDELLTKDVTFNRNEFSKVESMLSTIMKLLEESAKIVITSRKTALFNSEQFYNWANATENKFSVARFEIKEPTVKNWLSGERLELIENSDFPINKLANPVLLSYLRNIPLEKLKAFLDDNHTQSIVDQYIDFLLSREQDRQSLRMDNNTQLRVFRKLVRFMTEYDFKSESKEIIKDFIKSYNKTIINDCLQKYNPGERPSFDELVETLSNHVFLDRKQSGSVGFVNDFILGHLIGENLIMDKYKQYYPNFNELFNQTFAILATTAFKSNSEKNRDLLWKIFNDYKFEFDQNFYFDIDISFKDGIRRNFDKIVIMDETIKCVEFCPPQRITNSTFSNVVFNNCKFDVDIFENTIFQGCKFYDCELCNIKPDSYKLKFQTFGCSANNSILDDLLSSDGSDYETNHQEITELDILEKYFKSDKKRPRHRTLSQIRGEFTDEEAIKRVNRLIAKLKSSGYLTFNGDMSFITKEGIRYFHEQYNND
ncbi:NACHT domain-containing protein [Thermophagus sp. OGC60D27]|uniref:NACHT domain-containing protein n=1 Tax=Thermophagus sp. OGC60D27 TaxID=3458415 RepID=UPI004038419F